MDAVCQRASPLPVRQLVARSANARDHWTLVRDLLHDEPRCVELLRDAHLEARLPHRVGILRTLDVLLWMSDSDKRLPPPN